MVFFMRKPVLEVKAMLPLADDGLGNVQALGQLLLRKAKQLALGFNRQKTSLPFVQNSQT